MITNIPIQVCWRPRQGHFCLLFLNPSMVIMYLYLVKVRGLDQPSATILFGRNIIQLKLVVAN